MEIPHRPYLARLKQAFPAKSDPELELLCSSSLQIQKTTGISAHEHRKRGMQALFPSRVWHEWREQRILSVQECLASRTQELMWIGSSNSNKTGDAADTAVTLWLTKPEMTTIYIASPYESATETGVWAEIQEQFNEAKRHNPSLPGKIRHSDNSIVLYERNPRSFIRVCTVDAVGKLVGKKSRQQTEGLIVLILDELPAFTAAATAALFQVMPNLISNKNLLVIGTGNFAHPGDALGIFTDPDERDVPGGFDQFDADLHHRWRTKRGGLCLRFDGLKSPNVKAGTDLYPFLTTIEYIGKLAAQPGGLQSPASMRFIRSAPVTSLDEYTVTNGERIKAGGCFEPYEWTGDDVQIGAFNDAGFGGDACIIQKFKLGYTRLTGGGRRQTLALWEGPFEVPIKVGLRENGQIVTAETQIVRGTRDHCRKFGIPEQNIGFDGSLRAGIVQAFAGWSLAIQAIDSQGAATSRPVSATEKHEPKTQGAQALPVLWKERVDRLLSEFWFAAALLIDSGQVRGLELSPKAQRQMCSRRWTWIGTKKRKVQTKLDYKDMLRAQAQPVESPNEADALVGCIEVARRMGLNLAGLSPGGGSLSIILQMIRDREIPKLVKLIKGDVSLKSGELHGRGRITSGVTSGRLHRRP